MEQAVESPAPLWAISAAPPEAVAFMRVTWLRAYAGSQFARAMRPGIFHRFHGEVVTRLLARSSARVAMAGDVWLGWSVYDADALHFVYVKPQFRHLGIGRALVAGCPPRFSHATASGLRLAGHYPEWAYNPYLAMEHICAS